MSGLLYERGGAISGAPFLVGAAIALIASPAVLMVGRRLLPADRRASA